MVARKRNRASEIPVDGRVKQLQPTIGGLVQSINEFLDFQSSRRREIAV
jgi:hypothetical protein